MSQHHRIRTNPVGATTNPVEASSNPVAKQVTWGTLIFSFVTLGKDMHYRLGHCRLEKCSASEFAELKRRYIAIAGESEWSRGLDQVWSALEEEQDRLPSAETDSQPQYVPRYKYGWDPLVERVNRWLEHGSTTAVGLTAYVNGMDLLGAISTSPELLMSRDQTEEATPGGSSGQSHHNYVNYYNAEGYDANGYHWSDYDAVNGDAI